MAIGGITVLVVDDSSVVRQYLSDFLTAQPAIGEVLSAPDGKLALRKIKQHDPDVVTLDIEMPGMDGLETLREIMHQFPRPVIMLSAFAKSGAMKTVRALELGALDFIRKPSGQTRDIQEISDELITKIVAVAESADKIRRKYSHRSPSAPPPEIKPPIDFELIPRGIKPTVVAIGASTGGIEAISRIIGSLKNDFPAGVVVVQHMPEGFTKTFAERLNTLCDVEVKEAEHRDVILPGRVLIAPGHSHMLARSDGEIFYVELEQTKKISGHRPSVDVLFRSVADVVGSCAVAVQLTGMGNDGARGLRLMKKEGAYTIAQDAESSVVFGMPKAAIETGCVDLVTNLESISYLLSVDFARRSTRNPSIF